MNPATLPLFYVPPQTLLVLGIAALVLLAVSWVQNRQAAARSARARAVFQLADRIAASSSLASIAGEVTQQLRTILRVSHARLWRYAPDRESLECLPLPGELAEPDQSLEPGLQPNLLQLASLNQIALQVGNSRLQRHPQHLTGAVSAAAVPMIAHGTFLGILEIGDQRPRRLTLEEILLLQLVASQAGVLLRREQQATLEDQMRRTERIALAGTLVSAATKELQAPLARLRRLSETNAAWTPEEFRLRLAAAEDISDDAAFRMERLLNLIRPAPTVIQDIDALELLNPLIDSAHNASLPLRVQAPPRAPILSTAPAQIHPILQTLLQPDFVDDDHSLTISIVAATDLSLLRFERAGYGIHVDDALLDLCSGIIRSLGGELKLLASPGTLHIDLRLPTILDRTPQPKLSDTATLNPLTVLAVEPDPNQRHELVQLLSRLGHRAVPAADADEAQQLLDQLTFDTVLASSLLPGRSWPDLLESSARSRRSFILIAEAQEADLLTTLRARGAWLLSRPVSVEQLDAALRATSSKNAEPQSK